MQRPRTRRYGAFIERARRESSVETRSALGFSNGTPAYQFDHAQWSTADHESYRRAFVSQVAVYACVLRRAQSVAEAPLRVYKETDGDLVEQSKHSLRYLFARPNPVVSEAEFHALTMTYCDAVGYAAIEKRRAPAGNVVELWHLRADWLKRIPRRNAPDDYEYRVPGREAIILPAEDVLIVPGGPSTDLSPFGMSPIAAAMREININDSTTNYLKLFLDGGAVPRQAIVYPRELAGEKGQRTADEIKERWRLAYGGFQNWHNIALLHGGMDVKQIGTNLDELSYPGLRAMTESRICSAFGVPGQIVGIESAMNPTYSNFEQARKAFFEDTVSPLWKRLAGAYERALLFEATDDNLLSLRFDTSDVTALQEDKAAVWSRVNAAARDGLVTINQFQTAVGLPGFGADGDVLYLPMSAQVTRPEDLGKKADAEPVDDLDVDEEPDDTPEVDEDVLDAEVEDKERATKRELEVRLHESFTRQGVETRLVPFETRSRIAKNHRIAVTKLAAKSVGPIRAALQRDVEAVLAPIRSAVGSIETNDGALPTERRDAELDKVMRGLNSAVFGKETERALNDLYALAGVSAYRGVAKEVGRLAYDWNLSNPQVRQTMRELGRRITKVNQTTKEQVGQIIADSIEAGQTPDQMVEAINAKVEQTYANRSLAIARTEGQVAYNISTADAYKASGRVLAMTLHDNPAHTEPYGATDGLTCAQRNGLITDVDKASTHIYAEHPNGTLAASPLLITPLGRS